MFEQGGINAADSTVINGISYQQASKDRTNPARIMSKQLIKVKPNARYSINYQGFLIPFDKNGSYIKVKSKTIDFIPTSTFTMPSNAYYIALCLKDSNTSNAIAPSTLDSLNLTLQEVTDEIVLRSIGDVKDTLNLTTGEYVQRIGEIVLDGSDDEGWTFDSNDSLSNTNRFYSKNNILSDAKSSPSNTLNDAGLIDLPLGTSTGDNEHICIVGGKIYIRKNKTEYSDLNTFKNWLAQNPLTVQYELATPIIKKVNLTNPTKLPSYASTTHYDTIVPSNSLVPNIKIPSTIDYNVAIKPSTQYTIRANTTSAMSVNLGGSTGTLANGKVTLTTPSILAHSSLKLGNGKAKEVMVVEGSEIKDNVPFFNGMKNVQMGGIKLVNIARGATPNGLVTANANKTQFTYTSDGTNWGKIIFDKSLLKPNTKYTIKMNVISNCSSIKVQLGHAGWNYYNINNNVTGIISGTIVSPPTVKCGLPSSDANYFDDSFCIYFRNADSSQQTVIQNPMIIEGDWTHLDEIPFIESEMIIEQPVIRSQGKNLFDLAKFSQYSYVTGTIPNGVILGLVQYDITELMGIKFKPNTRYTVTFNSKTIEGEGNHYFRVYYSDGTNDYINGSSASTTAIGKTVSRLYTSFDISGKCEVTNIQIEEGTTATTYEPFKQHTLYSNRVIGYEENCYHDYRNGAKTTVAGYSSVLADVEGLSIAYVTNGGSN